MNRTGMNLTRRDLARLAGLLLPLEAGCLSQRPESNLLRSRIPLPRPFEAPLPIPPVLRPVKADASTDYYDMTACTARARILPGMTTEIWSYGGFPRPTIEARSGRGVSLLLRNDLPAPIVNHLHGGRTPPESDGYPTDFILPSARKEFIYPNNQRAATLWYHDHRMDFTGPQMWRGLAGFYLLRDDEEDRLPLPRGDKEIPLMICDRSFNADGSLLYPSLDPSLRKRGIQRDYLGGVLGDVILVNGAPWPRMEVANTRYRLRLLNASNARRYELALDPPPPRGAAFVQIGSDGGLLASPVGHRTIRMAPAERFDVVVDFAGYKSGTNVTLLNTAGSGSTAQIMRFHVTRTERDESAVPARLSDIEPADRKSASVERVFKFSYRRGMQSWTINGKPFDPLRMDARPKLNATEVWQLQTDFNHPLHIHLVHFRVLSHSGRPGPYDAGWKDTIDLGPGQTANVLMKFIGFRGRYLFHCHNLEHEDMSMMANFEVI